MAIKLFTDRIQIGDYVLTEGNNGLLFTGVAAADFVGSSPQQGTQHAYVAGGNTYGTPSTNTIERYAFPTDSNSSSIGVLASPSVNFAAVSSTQHGYAGGTGASNPSPTNTIERFPFASSSNSSSIGAMSVAYYGRRGSGSTERGYFTGGLRTPGGSYSSINTIDKFPFASSSNGTNIGSLTTLTGYGAGHSSQTSGYHSGGVNWIPASQTDTSVINKFPFAFDSSASAVGNLINATQNPSFLSSASRAYVLWDPGDSFRITRWPFASDSNAVDVGDTAVGAFQAAGTASTTYGYFADGGGNYGSNKINKFPFAAENTSVQVGSLAPFPPNPFPFNLGYVQRGSFQQ